MLNVPEHTSNCIVIRQFYSLVQLLKAKGFESVLAVIGDEDVNVIVEGPIDSAATVKIQDAVIAQTDFALPQIKIISSDK